MSLPDFFTKGHNRVRGKRVARLSANGTVALPKGVMIDKLYLRNTTANAVTGGVRFGTTAAGVDVHATVAVAASAVVRADPLISGYNAAASTLYIEAVTAWNSAVVDVVVDYTEITTRTEPTSNIVSDATFK